MSREWESIQRVEHKDLFVVQRILEEITAWATKYGTASREGDDAHHSVRHELRVLDSVNAEIMRRARIDVTSGSKGGE